MFNSLFPAHIIAGLGLVLAVQVLPAQDLSKEENVERKLGFSYTSEIVATRSDTAVSLQDLDGRMATLPDDRMKDVLGSPERVAGILNGVLLTFHLADAAVDRGLLSDPEVQAEIHLAAMEVLAQKERDRHVAENLLDDYTSQARETYLLDPESFRQPERATFTHLLLRTDNAESGAAAVEERARALLERARDGESVSDLALKYSEDPSIQNNGGFFRDIPIADLEPTFRSELQELSEGDLDLIKSTYGYHVLELNERKPARVRPFEEIADQLREQARAAHAKEIFESYVAEFYENELQLREGAVAKIIDRYTDPQN